MDASWSFSLTLDIHTVITDEIGERAETSLNMNEMLQGVVCAFPEIKKKRKKKAHLTQHNLNALLQENAWTVDGYDDKLRRIWKSDL